MIPLAPPSPYGYPAPFWLLESLKVLGFSLHIAPMNLWYAGMPVAFLLGLFGGIHARKLARRLGGVMPFAIALGINFGVVPLLFTQVVNYQFFYTAGVLIAWPWFSVIALLIVAYSGAYIHAKSSRRTLILVSGGVSAIFLVGIGFLFANNFSLMVNPSQWLAIFQRTAPAGAPTGLALNFGDPTLLPRWLMMFGLALMTTATYMVLDTAVFARQEPADYKNWAGRFALALYTLGLLWFAATGSWYIFGTLSASMHRAMLANRLIVILMLLTAIGPGLPWLLIIIWRRVNSATLAGLAALGQFGVIALNAISRQWVQNMELRPYADLAAVPVRGQWSALALFFIMFIAAIWLSLWLALKLRSALQRA